MAKKENIKIPEKELFNKEKKALKKLNQKGLLNVSGGVSAKQFMIGCSLLSLVLFGAGAVNNSIDVYADDTPQSSISQTMSNAKSSKHTGKTVSPPQTKTFKIIKPSFKNTARGKLYLQKQRQEEAKRLALRREHIRECHRQQRANLSDEQKEQMRAQARARYANLPEEQKRQRNERQREYHRQRRANLSDEQKEQIRAQERQRRANLSDEQKEQIRAQARARYANRTDEQKQHTRARAQARYANLSEEQKRQKNERSRQRYANLSDEQKEQIRAKARARQRQRYASLPAYKKQQIIERNRYYRHRRANLVSLTEGKRQAANAADHVSDEPSLDISLTGTSSTYEPSVDENAFQSLLDRALTYGPSTDEKSPDGLWRWPRLHWGSYIPPMQEPPEDPSSSDEVN